MSAKKGVAYWALLAHLRPLHGDYAELVAAQYAERVTVNADGEPDAASIKSIAQEIVTGADRRYRADGDEDSAFDRIRREMQARIEAGQRAEAARKAAFDRMEGR